MIENHDGGGTGAHSNLNARGQPAIAWVQFPKDAFRKCGRLGHPACV
jgi:hypothetical protein